MISCPATAGQVVSLLRQIPVWARRFSVTPDEALAGYRISGDLLREFAELGLPHVMDGDVPLFDGYDLTNLALYLRLRSPQRAAMRYWANVLTRPAGERREYQLDYLAACPVPGHLGECEFLCCLPGCGETVVRRRGEGTGPLTSVVVILHNDWPPLPPPLAAAIEEIAHIRFFRLPDAVKTDLGFMFTAQIGDCLGIARYLAAEGARRGLQTRAVFGLIVAPPYATPHFWAEVAMDGRWVPADPGLIQGMVDWGALPRGWPPDRSPGAFLVPLTHRHGFAVSHEGVSAAVSFRTSVPQPGSGHGI
jgi:hypothetical protein